MKRYNPVALFKRVYCRNTAINESEPTKKWSSQRGAGSVEFTWAMVAIAAAVIVSFVGLGGSVKDLVNARTQQVAGQPADVDPIGDTGVGSEGQGHTPGTGGRPDSGGGGGDGSSDDGSTSGGGNGSDGNGGAGSPPDDDDGGDGNDSDGSDGSGDDAPDTDFFPDGDGPTPDLTPDQLAVEEFRCETTWDDERYNKGEGSWLNPANWAGKIESGIAVVTDFVRGLIAGLGDQARDLWQLISNPATLVELGRAFISDPLGTLEDIIDGVITGLQEDVRRIFECGPSDVGRVIGQNVNPVVALRVVARVAGSARLLRVVDDLPDNFGCASFTEGTLIATPDGMVAIELLQAGDMVRSRDENTFSLVDQPITQLKRRVAPRVFEVETWSGRVLVTEEHPFWVQGKGWVRVIDLEPEDPIATINGDDVYLGKSLASQDTQVYNFSVGTTKNYFAGESSYWVHNADRTCTIRRAEPDLNSNYTFRKPDNDTFDGPNDGVYRAAGRDADGSIVYQEADSGQFFKLDETGTPQRFSDASTRSRTGLAGEHRVTDDLDARGYDKVNGELPENIDGYQGDTGIDGVYRNRETGEYLVVETKSTGGAGNADGTVGRLGTSNDGTQLSDRWTRNRVANELDDVELERFNAAQDAGDVRVVKAEVRETRVGNASGSGQTGDIQYRSVVTGETTAQVGDVITDI